MEINSRLIPLRSVFISISCTDSAHVFQKRPGAFCHGGAAGPEFMRCATKKYILRTLCGNCRGEEMKDARGEGGRWPPPARERAAISGQAWKTHRRSLQMTPCETGVVVNDTNSTARTLQWEPDTHLHCQTERLLLKNGARIVI